MYTNIIKLWVNGAFKTKQRGLEISRSCYVSTFMCKYKKTRRHTQSMRNTTNVHCPSNMLDLPFQNEAAWSILKLSKTVMYRNASACTGMSRLIFQGVGGNRCEPYRTLMSKLFVSPFRFFEIVNVYFMKTTSLGWLILHPCVQTRKSSTVMWPDFPVFSRQIGKKKWTLSVQK